MTELPANQAFHAMHVTSRRLHHAAILHRSFALHYLNYSICAVFFESNNPCERGGVKG
jgi:hypothetical protein